MVLHSLDGQLDLLGQHLELGQVGQLQLKLRLADVLNTKQVQVLLAQVEPIGQVIDHFAGEEKVVTILDLLDYFGIGLVNSGEDYPGLGDLVSEEFVLFGPLHLQDHLVVLDERATVVLAHVGPVAVFAYDGELFAVHVGNEDEIVGMGQIRLDVLDQHIMSDDRVTLAAVTTEERNALVSHEVHMLVVCLRPSYLRYLYLLTLPLLLQHLLEHALKHVPLFPVVERLEHHSIMALTK